MSKRESGHRRRAQPGSDAHGPRAPAVPEAAPPSAGSGRRRPRLQPHGDRVRRTMSTMSDTPTKFLLTEDRIPTHWVNLLPDLPGAPLPPLHPGTMQPAGPSDLTPIFPMALIEQEVATSPEVEIPDEVRDAYRLWRPTPLYRAL